MFGPEDRAQVLHPVMQGAGPAWPTPFVGVVRIAKEVVVAVGLFGQLGHITMVAMDRAEAPGAIGIQVQLALSRGDQLRKRFPDPAGTAEAVQRQPGCHEQAMDARHRSQQRIRVWGHGVRMADEFDDACLADEGKAARRALKERLEATLVGSDGGPGVLPGDTVDPTRVGVQLIAAQHHTARLGLSIDEVVGVAKARHGLRQFGALDRLQCGMLVIDRRRNDKRAGHGRHLRGPDAARDHHHLSLDSPALRLHRLDGSIR